MVTRAVPTWSAALVAGLLGGLLYGILVHGIGMMPLVGALVGIPNLIVGWTVHLAFAVAFALVYVGLVSNTGLAAWAHRPSTGWVLGAAYATIVWIVAASLIMPAWLNVVGATTTAVPTFDGRLLVGHLIYGVTLGAAYPAFIGAEERSATVA